MVDAAQSWMTASSMKRCVHPDIEEWTDGIKREKISSDSARWGEGRRYPPGELQVTQELVFQTTTGQTVTSERERE